MILKVKSMDCFSKKSPPKQPKNEAIPLKIQGFGTEPINIKPRICAVYVCMQKYYNCKKESSYSW